MLVSQLCLTFCDLMDCSLPGSSVYGILQGIILEWVAISFSRDLPDPGIKPRSQKNKQTKKNPGLLHCRQNVYCLNHHGSSYVIYLVLFYGWVMWHISEKTLASLTTLKPMTVWITTNCGKFLKERESQTTLPAPWETCIQVKKQQLELAMEQQTGSNLGKEYHKFVCCHSYLTSIQRTLYEMLGWMKHKLESRFQGEISVTLRYADDTTKTKRN